MTGHHDRALALQIRDVRHAPKRRVRTYGRERRCPCGTLLSRYNPEAICAPCDAWLAAHEVIGA